MAEPLRGLLAATCTPFEEDGSLDIAAIPRVVDHLLLMDVAGIYIAGSTGEGLSLSTSERCRVAEAFVEAVDGRIRTIVHVGHNSLAEARQLASHAASIGADVISATAPSYFPVDNVDTLVESMGEVAAGAPDLPFYYYHIPKFTSSNLDMVEFLEAADGRLPNLAGIKYTATTVHEYQACCDLYEGRFDIVWGCDEMLLSALAVGAKAAIGSTYNIAAPLYSRIIEAFERGDCREARAYQMIAVNLIRILSRYPFLAALKFVLSLSGVPCGPCRAPLRSLTKAQELQLRQDLEASGLMAWLAVSPSSPISSC